MALEVPLKVLMRTVLGHDRQIETIERTISNGKIPHSCLFVGIEGIGKKLVALRLAQAIQCNSENERPCDNCSACRKAAEGIHPDIIVVEADGNFIKIDQIRELQKKLGYKPFEGRGTVCIIDGADKMNAAAGNALLKTLEEPPSSSYLILLAENIRKVIPTVISRCQKIKFNPLPSEIIAKILLREKNLSPEEGASISRLCEGSVGKGADLIERFSFRERDKLFEDLVNLNSMGTLFSIADDMTKKKDNDNLFHVLEIIKLYIRDIIAVKTGINHEKLINYFSRDLIGKEAEKYSIHSLIDMVEAVSRAEQDLMKNINKRLAIENMLINFYNHKAGTC